MTDKPSAGELAIYAIEKWQKNHLTTFTPSNILHDFGDVILAALRSPPVAGAEVGVKPGFRLVPYKPTQAMLDAVCSSDGHEPWTDKTMTSVYQEMLDAFDRDPPTPVAETITLTVTDLVNTRDKVIQECVTAALEQRCERFTEWDLACTTLADRLRALSSVSAPVAERMSPNDYNNECKRTPTQSELEILREFYDVAKATDRYFVEIAQNDALGDGRQDYRFYMGLHEKNLDIAIQKVEDWKRDAASPAPPVAERGGGGAGGASSDRTWDVALAERVQQLEGAGCKTLTCAQVLGLIAFVRDGEGIASPTPETGDGSETIGGGE